VHAVLGAAGGDLACGVERHPDLVGEPAVIMLIGDELRRGDCGVWHHASDAAGQPRGALLVDPELLATSGALDRLVAIVARVRAAAVDGVLPVLDLIEQPTEAGDAIWLITALPPDRTLADLEPGEEATAALRQVGQTLAALHAVGLAHGALSASTVVLGPGGQVLLAEVGMRAAMSGTSADAASDAQEHARLTGSPTPAEHGDVRTDRTMLGRRGAATGTAAVATTTAPAAQQSENVPIRFGPGVPAVAPSGAAAVSGDVSRRSRRRRVRWASAVLTLAIIAGAALWWWHRLGGLAVESATVSSTPAVAGCAATVDVAADVTTNGRRGVLHYRWLRNDGQTTGELSQTVAGGQHSVTLHLAWTFAGHGDFAAVATLEVVSPGRTSAEGRFRYRCA
jgi:hypothetical protein